MKEFSFKLNGKDFKAQVDEKGDGRLTITVNGKAYSVEVPEQAKAVAPHVVRPTAAVAGGAPVARPAASSVSENVVAPLPGTITSVAVKEGQKVKRGDVVVVMEAMKMANDIVANQDGVVTRVVARPGQSVNQGDVLVEIQGEAASQAAPSAAPAPAPHAAPAADAGAVVAPLPGTIKQIKVKAGQDVQRGDVLVTLEAMKMENDIQATQAGKVKAVLVQSDQQVQQGDVLVEFE